MSEFSTFPPNFEETDDGEIAPSYQPGNGNQPRYPSGDLVDPEMPHDFDTETGQEQYQSLPVRKEDESSRGDFLDNNGGEFGFGPSAEGFENVYKKGIDEARKQLRKGE